MRDQEPRNWSDLTPELTCSILVRLGAVEILENAQKVCRSWRRISKEPSLWRKIDIRNLGDRKISGGSEMCRHAVNRSEGCLVEINIGNFGSDSLLIYIADRSPNLRSLGLVMNCLITTNGLVKAVSKLPLLEELELEVSNTFSTLDLKAIGHSCPKLKTLKLNCTGSILIPWVVHDDDDALAIAESMPQLHHLELIGNTLTNTGLNAILDKCPHLEHLDLRMCSNIYLWGDLEKRCLERVKDLRRPNDSTADYPYFAAFSDTGSDDDSDNI
ncbi:hypothetical protein AALP_AA6G211200 [Arabis alpina]|uniref:F-box domain-containing protein n=1 Tax=Arabis alpina TaxID=50452 RepID=A0A087GQQ5_ARAAL|nr:hypothetical protein AALP_AA6G211200 [Arabis alpina]